LVQLSSVGGFVLVMILSQDIYFVFYLLCTRLIYYRFEPAYIKVKVFLS